MTNGFSIHPGKPLGQMTADDELKIPDGMILTAYRGSVAHNMYVPRNDPNHIDDIDIIGIAIGESRHYFGLHEWGRRGTKETKQGQWDCVWYEIRKAVSLLLQGNPNILSLLWLRDNDYIDVRPSGKRLLANRGLFAGKHVYDSFAGYASAQLQKMESRDPEDLRQYLAVTAELKYRGAHPNHKGEEFPRFASDDGMARDVAAWSTEKLLAKNTHYRKKGDNTGYMGDKRKRLVVDLGYDAKNAAHCIRLLRMAKEFLNTGAMQVFRTTDREELLEIKAGKWTLAQIKEHAEQLFSEVEAARDSSPLPPEPNHQGAETLLIDILREELFAAREKGETHER